MIGPNGDSYVIENAAVLDMPDLIVSDDVWCEMDSGTGLPVQRPMSLDDLPGDIKIAKCGFLKPRTMIACTADGKVIVNALLNGTESTEGW